MGYTSSVDTIVGTSRQFPELLCQAGAEIEKVRNDEGFFFSIINFHQNKENLLKIFCAKNKRKKNLEQWTMNELAVILHNFLWVVFFLILIVPNDITKDFNVK